MIRIMLSGANGRMGRAITGLAEASGDLRITHFVDLGENFEDPDSVSGDDVDVSVDLSSPEGTRKILAWSVAHKKPLVIGTTGLTAEDHSMIDEASKVIPVLQASNLSRGVNILFKLLESAAARTRDADIEIVELHHNKKKDAPSGTALEMGRIISKVQSERDLKEKDGRSGLEGARPDNEICYHSIRCGDAVGEHTAIFGYDGERLEITHRASSRSILAKGAIEALRFIVNRQPGRYSMLDVIDEK